MKKRTYLTLGSVGAVGLLLVSSTSAYANWSSHIEGGRPGFASRVWADKSYTEVTFKGCRPTEPASNFDKSVDIQLYTAGFGDKVGPLKHFTKCFELSTSTATWTGLPKGLYYFKIVKIGGESHELKKIDVDQVRVDTTLAD
ncbi:hypothetical protein QFW82_00265 [Streptomyces malaysiensis subsp. malaysiensis]|uniref:hypothetical protein n=1 Tax=Streptomyces malaysiensis TaxID=92644 RepID=UPI0024BFE555|nr:hypothetical protein [Streptomyces sp. NA07423]WHX15576.1 hypothetical protein QFW82_00265 [Streptomyces sp. NA07423]